MKQKEKEEKQSGKDPKINSNGKRWWWVCAVRKHEARPAQDEWI